MRLKNIVRALRDKIKGSLNVAISQGMIVGNNIRIMGGGQFRLGTVFNRDWKRCYHFLYRHLWS